MVKKQLGQEIRNRRQKNRIEDNKKRKRNWLEHWLRKDCIPRDPIEGVDDARREKRP